MVASLCEGGGKGVWEGPVQGTAIVTSDNAEVKIVDLSTGVPAREKGNPSRRSHTCAAVTDGSFIYTTGKQGHVIVTQWNSSSSEGEVKSVLSDVRYLSADTAARGQCAAVCADGSVHTVASDGMSNRVAGSFKGGRTKESHGKHGKDSPVWSSCAVSRGQWVCAQVDTVTGSARVVRWSTSPGEADVPTAVEVGPTGPLSGDIKTHRYAFNPQGPGFIAVIDKETRGWRVVEMPRGISSSTSVARVVGGSRFTRRVDLSSAAIVPSSPGVWVVVAHAERVSGDGGDDGGDGDAGAAANDGSLPRLGRAKKSQHGAAGSLNPVAISISDAHAAVVHRDSVAAFPGPITSAYHAARDGCLLVVSAGAVHVVGHQRFAGTLAGCLGTASVTRQWLIRGSGNPDEENEDGEGQQGAAIDFDIEELLGKRIARLCGITIGGVGSDAGAADSDSDSDDDENTAKGGKGAKGKGKGKKKSGDSKKKGDADEIAGTARNDAAVAASVAERLASGDPAAAVSAREDVASLCGRPVAPSPSAVNTIASACVALLRQQHSNSNTTTTTKKNKKKGGATGEGVASIAREIADICLATGKVTSSSGASGLIDYAISSGDLSMLRSYITRCADASERDVFAAVQVALAAPQEDVEALEFAPGTVLPAGSGSSKKGGQGSVDGIPPQIAPTTCARDALLGELLSAPRRTAPSLIAIRSLSRPQTLALLRFLTRALRAIGRGGVDCTSYGPMSISAAITASSEMMDARFAELAIASECHDDVVAFGKALRHSLATAEALARVKTVVAAAVSGTQGVVTHKVPEYSIEVL